MLDGQTNETEFRSTPPGLSNNDEDRIVQGLADALDYVFECKREREASSANANANANANAGDSASRASRQAHM